ncbi:MAG: MazG-like family protein [Sporomusaceae bacterium]|nr:MazG-like family protein [Sporomusaceae bacterium]
MLHQEPDLLKKIKLMDWLKAQLAVGVGQVLSAAAERSENLLVEALASLAVTVYILARRMGIDFSVLEEAMLQKVKNLGRQSSELERQFGDYSQLERYLRQKR